MLLRGGAPVLPARACAAGLSSGNEAHARGHCVSCEGHEADGLAQARAERGRKQSPNPNRAARPTAKRRWSCAAAEEDARASRGRFVRQPAKTRAPAAENSRASPRKTRAPAAE